jgi:hypothetical protein
LKIPLAEHFKLCQGNNQLISNQGISLDKALVGAIIQPEGSLSEVRRQLTDFFCRSSFYERFLVGLPARTPGGVPFPQARPKAFRVGLCFYTRRAGGAFWFSFHCLFSLQLKLSLAVVKSLIMVSKELCMASGQHLCRNFLPN